MQDIIAQELQTGTIYDFASGVQSSQGFVAHLVPSTSANRFCHNTITYHDLVLNSQMGPHSYISTATAEHSAPQIRWHGMCSKRVPHRCTYGPRKLTTPSAATKVGSLPSAVDASANIYVYVCTAQVNETRSLSVVERTHLEMSLLNCRPCQ